MSATACCRQVGLGLLSLGLVVMWLCFDSPSLALDISSSPATDVFTQQGKHLRAELEHRYRGSTEAGQSPGRGIDVTSTIAKYIPVGTSFDDAERILQSAGFKMAPRPPRPIYREQAPEWEKALRFTMSGELILDQVFLTSSTSVWVSLFPDTPGDPKARVKEIQAQLKTTYL